MKAMLLKGGGIFLATALFLFLASLALSVSLFHLPFYQREMEKYDIAAVVQESIVGLAAPDFVQRLRGALSDQELERELKAAFSQELIRAELAGVLGNLVSYLSGRSEALDLTISVAEAKRPLTAYFHKVAAERASAPVSWGEKTAGELLNEQAAFVIAFPDRLDLTVGRDLGPLKKTRTLLQVFTHAVAAGTVAAVLLLLFLAGRSSRSLRLRWTGIGFLLSGGFLILFLVYLAYRVTAAARGELAASVARDLAVRIASIGLLEAAAVAAIGVYFFLVSRRPSPVTPNDPSISRFCAVR